MRALWEQSRRAFLVSKEMNQCHINQNVPVPTPAAVGSLHVGNTVPSIRRLWTNNTTSTSVTPSQTNATVVVGNESVTAT